MRILYLSLSYIPSRRASSVQVMKMCAAMARLGHEVVLVAKDGRSAKGGDDFAFYGVERCFRLEKLPRPRARGGSAVYAAAMARQVAAYRRWADLVYCRDPLGGAMAALVGLPLVFEAHGPPAGRLQRAMWQRMVTSRRFVAMVAISEGLRRELDALGLLPAAPCLVAHDAADPPALSSTVVPRPVGRPPRIGYVGSLYRGRGVDLVLELARLMPDCQFDLVGGLERDLQQWRESGPPANAVFHGFHPPSRLNEFYARFDAVLMPYSRDGVVGPAGLRDTSRWASPMKMFEYMASGVPLVSSDLPVLQEVLRPGENAFIAAADDAGEWVEKLRLLLGDDELRCRLARTAQEDLVRGYSWDARARHVFSLLPIAGSSTAGASAAGPS